MSEQDPTDFVDVNAIIQKTSLAEHIARADHYFSWMGDDASILKKPFNNVAEAAETLQGVSLLLRFSDLFPGAKVVDFGAGTAWLSRDLALLGCEVTAVDISAAALELGKRANEKHPFAKEMSISYQSFDGANLDLPSNHFDNIICFSSFHHVAAEQALLQHFHRILRPGGIVSFYEPGPHHSRQPQSQQEMRHYGVIERDIDIDRIWQTASEIGFVDLRLAKYMPDPALVSMSDFARLLTEPVSLDLAPSYFNIRPFFLYKAGQRKLDSRFGRGLTASITAQTVALADGRFRATITLGNIGEASWLPSTTPKGGVCISSRLLDDQDHVLDAHFASWWVIDRHIEPGESFTVEVEIPAPPRPGLRLALGLVADRVAHFDGPGNIPCIIALDALA